MVGGGGDQTCVEDYVIWTADAESTGISWILFRQRTPERLRNGESNPNGNVSWFTAEIPFWESSLFIPRLDPSIPIIVQ